MCRDLISIGYDGSIYDCDFNQQLALGIKKSNQDSNVFNIDSFEELEDVPIENGNHCFGCTAGFGSSWSGNIA